MLKALDTPLLFVTGKGGVGKSTVCAAIGLALSGQGKKVLVVEIDTYSALAGILSLKLEASVPAPTPYPGLEVVNLHAEDALIEALRQFVPSDRVSKAVIQNRIARVFFGAAPSVNEFSLLHRISRYLSPGAGGYDHVVVDMPASGHAVTFLKVPQTLEGMIRVGPLAKISQALKAQVQDPAQAALIAVCLPEEMPVNETIELAKGLEQGLARPLTLAVLNMVHEAPVAPGRASMLRALGEAIEPPPLEASGGATPLARVVQASSLAMTWHTRDAHYAGELARRLPSKVPIVEVPNFYGAAAKDLIERMAGLFAAASPAGARAS